MDDTACWSLDLPPITPAVLAAYATASGDRNPLHLDRAAAQAAGEPDVIAHGMLTMAYLGRLVTGLDPDADLVSFSVRFVAKTPVGGRVTCRAEPTEPTEPTEPQGLEHSEQLVHLALTAQLQDGTVTARGEAVCRPSGADRGGRR